MFFSKRHAIRIIAYNPLPRCRLPSFLNICSMKNFMLFQLPIFDKYPQNTACMGSENNIRYELLSKYCNITWQTASRILLFLITILTSADRLHDFECFLMRSMYVCKRVRTRDQELYFIGFIPRLSSAYCSWPKDFISRRSSSPSPRCDCSLAHLLYITYEEK